MIYVLIVAILGFSAWQLVSFVKKAKRGSCASGCGGCESIGHCSLPQHEQFKQN